MNQTKNASISTNYHIKEGKPNFIAVFYDKSVTAAKKQNQLQ